MPVRRLGWLDERYSLQRRASVNGSGVHRCRGVPDGVDGLEQHQQLHRGADDTVSDGVDSVEPGRFVHRFSDATMRVLSLVPL